MNSERSYYEEQKVVWMDNIAMDGMARIVIEEMIAFFAIPENEKKFEEWKKRRDTSDGKTQEDR